VSVLIFREAGAMLTEQIANLLKSSECADIREAPAEKHHSHRHLTSLIPFNMNICLGYILGYALLDVSLITDFLLCH